MDFITILFIGIGLAMDASAVSLAKGMGLDKDQVKKYAFILALAFGLFQALMPAIGYFAGSHFAEYIQSIDHWIAFILLSLIGINMICEGKEEKENEVKINEHQAELDNEQNRAVTSDMFLSSVRKYTRARKLTPRMLNELIDKIEVYQAEKIDGKKVQRLKIHYNCIGAIEIPDLSKLPENNVSVHTRQGVNVQYAALAV